MTQQEPNYYLTDSNGTKVGALGVNAAGDPVLEHLDSGEQVVVTSQGLAAGSADISELSAERLNTDYTFASKHATLQDAISSVPDNNGVVFVDADFGSEDVTISSQWLMGTGTLFFSREVNSVELTGDGRVENLRASTIDLTSSRGRVHNCYNATINISSNRCAVIGCDSVDVSSNGESYAAVGNTDSAFDGNQVNNS